MKSSTFSLFAIGFVLSAYAGMALLDHSKGNAISQEAANIKQAREQCGNADWKMYVDGPSLVITCIPRKPLRGGRAKP